MLRLLWGLVNVGVAVADEPGSWETIAGGNLMWDALTGRFGEAR